VATKGVRFGHVALRTADVERIVRWYDDAFGAKKVFHAPRDGERQELMFLEFAKGRYIEIFTNGKPRIEQPADAVGYKHFCLVVDDLDETLKHLASMGVHPQRPPREGRSHYRIAFISDPDGSVIELMQIRPESANCRDTTWPAIGIDWH
jgi:catechol 2,3-dioxygenase-like lactoylglutathione lyase family enzyme